MKKPLRRRPAGSWLPLGIFLSALFSAAAPTGGAAAAGECGPASAGAAYRTIQSVSYLAGTHVTCAAGSLLTAGPAVQVSPGAGVRYSAPVVHLRPGFRAAYGATFAAEPAPQTGYALIYNGSVAAEGAAEAVAVIAAQAGLASRFVSNLALLPGLLDQAAVFVVGGTEDDLSPLIAAFTPTVKTALTTYLQGGGRYWGICGGGFLASTGWEDYDGFVPMLGIAPAESGDLDGNYAPRILPVEWLGATYLMYFQAGPTFYLEPTAEAVQVIAHYQSGEIAALMNSYGAGKVAVSGPHPEADDSWLYEVAYDPGWTPTGALAVAMLQGLLSANPVAPSQAGEKP
jgi:hypothetical protein